MPGIHHQNRWLSSQKAFQKVFKGVMKSYHFRIPNHDYPVRIRPWFFVFTCLIMLALAFLGFTNFSRSLPLNDKILHFLCFCIATGVFYFILDIEEDARRIWFWRYAPLLLTGFTCFFCGGIISEFIQSLLPYKEFQFFDIVANLLGSSFGLWVAYHLDKYYRHRQEIARLYRPLDSEPLSDLDDDPGVELPISTYIPLPKVNGKQKSNARAYGDVWDEREELFGIGDDSDVDEPQNRISTTSIAQKPVISEV